MTHPSATTSLWFENGAEEAAIYYCSLFDDACIRSIMHHGNDPASPAFLVEFELMGQHFAAMNGGPHYRLTPAVSISINVETQNEVDFLWDALLHDGGVESQCGWLTDRWGLSWQIIPRALPRLLRADQSGRVMAAMMAMVKIDIAALESAARG